MSLSEARLLFGVEGLVVLNVLLLLGASGAALYFTIFRKRRTR